MLEPRRLAARAAATRLAVSLNEPLGERVGYSVRHEQKRSSRTRIEAMTDGLFLRRLQNDPSQAAFERQQKEIATQQAYIDRFRASATRSTQAKSREKQLDKVARVDAPVESVSGPSFRFPPAPRSGAQVALIENMTHCYGDNILFMETDLEIERGDRIAFVGPNGA